MSAFLNHGEIDLPAIVARLRDAAIDDADRLAALAERSWRILPRATPLEAIAIGQSRCGGAPDVPADFVWPMHGEQPLSFIAQLALADIGSPSLPPSGWLLFFYDAVDQPAGWDLGDADAAKVIYVDVPRDALSRRSHDNYEAVPYQPCAIDFSLGVDLPDQGDSVIAHAGLELSDTNEHLDSYHAVAKQLAGREPTDGDETYHHLLGNPQPLQNDMRRECALASNGFPHEAIIESEDERVHELLARAPDEWQLLLQLDSDDGPCWDWGSYGRLYFWIRRADLAARAFDKVWVRLQCT